MAQNNNGGNLFLFLFLLQSKHQLEKKDSSESLMKLLDVTDF